MKMQKFDGDFSKAMNMAHSVLKPTSKTTPANRASLGVKEISKTVCKLPNAGKKAGKMRY